MRRFVLIIMLFLLPLQFVWGAAARYCEHEQGDGVSHIGHHVHKHNALAKTLAGESTSDKGSAGGEDVDCDVCHLSCASAAVPAPVLAGDDARDRPHVDEIRVRTAAFPDFIERPNWASAA